MSEEVQKKLCWKIKSKELGSYVRHSNELFRVAHSMKSIQFGFEILSESDVYKIGVKYLGENIAGSPLVFSPLKEKKRKPPTVDFTSGKVWQRLGSLRSSTATAGCSPVKPWGGCVLRNGNLVVSSVAAQIMLFDQSLNFIKNISCEEGGGIERPADMAALSNGNFALKVTTEWCSKLNSFSQLQDRSGIRILDHNGNFVSRVTRSQYCFGLAEDEENGLWFIESVKTRENSKVFMLKCYDLVEEDLQEEVISLADITGFHSGSKCRFLTFFKGKLYITDLGLDKVYILDPKTKLLEITEAPEREGEVESWSGTAVDDRANLLVADYKNDRLCLFDRKGKFIKDVQVKNDLISLSKSVRTIPGGGQSSQPRAAGQGERTRLRPQPLGERARHQVRCGLS